MRNLCGIFARAGVVDKAKSLANTEAADKGANRSIEVKTQKQNYYTNTRIDDLYTVRKSRTGNLSRICDLLKFQYFPVDNLGNISTTSAIKFTTVLSSASSLKSWLSEAILNQREGDIVTYFAYHRKTVASIPDDDGWLFRL